MIIHNLSSSRKTIARFTSKLVCIFLRGVCTNIKSHIQVFFFFFEFFLGGGSADLHDSQKSLFVGYLSVLHPSSFRLASTSYFISWPPATYFYVM